MDSFQFAISFSTLRVAFSTTRACFLMRSGSPRIFMISALARALAADPKLLLLDEPMAGMNVEEKEDMSRFILDVNDEFGTTIVLIEHDMGVVMDLSDRVVVMDYGKKIGDGPPDEVRNNQAVIDAYLGVAHD